MKQNNTKLIANLCDVLSVLDTPQDCKAFLLDLCTPAEIQAMADRWHVVHPIKQGHSYRHIHADTGVSVTTIGRVARYITHGYGGYNLAYERQQEINNANQSKNQNRNSKKRASQS